MNIKQSIVNSQDRHVYVTAHQAAALISQCAPAEWAAYVADAAKASKGCLAVINKTRVLGGGASLRTSFPGVDEPAPVDTE